MRNLRSYVLGSGALLLLGAAVPLSASCSSGQAPAGTGGTTGAMGTGGTSGSGSGGTTGSGSGGTTGGGHDGGGSINCGMGCYAPASCAYQVKPPSTWALTNFATDTSTAVGSTTGAAPERVRIGLGGGTTHGKPDYADPTTSAVFTWETTEQDSDAKVEIGTSETSLTQSYAGYAYTIPPGIFGVAANMHEVHVCGLKAGTTYYYHVGGGAPGKEVWSATQSFTTVPAAGNKVTVGVFSDARDQVTTWTTVHQRMKTIGVDLQIITGDIVDLGPEESEWTTWLDAIWKSGSGGFLTLGEQMMVPIAGNHEAEAAEFYGNWSIPGTSADTYAKSYASFDVGNTHFVMYDDSPLASNLTTEAMAQQAWLEADLTAANANRSKVPFIIVGSHRGLYSTSYHQSDPDVLQARSVLAPIFDKYHVDIVFNGHDHEYERTNLLNAGSPANGAPVVKATAKSGSTVKSSEGTTYIINAGAGADPYSVGSGTVPSRATNNQLCFGSSCAASTYDGCYVVLELDGSTIQMTAYGMKGSSTKDTVIDSLTFTH